MIQALTPLVWRGGAVVPGFPDFSFNIVQHEHQPGCVFTIWQGSEPVTFCGLTWGESAARTVWADVDGVFLHLVLGGLWLGHTAPLPDKVPWLAEVRLREFFSRSDETQRWLVDFEPFLAWTILTVHAGPHPD